MYVIIFNARFLRIKGLTHAYFTTLFYTRFFFCELMGLTRIIVYSRGAGVLVALSSHVLIIHN